MSGQSPLDPFKTVGGILLKAGKSILNYVSPRSAGGDTTADTGDPTVDTDHEDPTETIDDAVEEEVVEEAAAEADPQPSPANKPLSVLVLGPTKHGKSIFLNALHHGADVALPTDGQFAPRISGRRMNDVMRDSAQEFDGLFRESPVDFGSTGIRELSFQMEMHGTLKNPSSVGPFEFEVMDVPGGMMTPDFDPDGDPDGDDAEAEEKINAFASKADAILLCLSCVDREGGLQDRDFERYWDKIKILPQGRPVLVCFTKFERMFFSQSHGVDLGALALREAMNRKEVQSRLVKILTENRILDIFLSNQRIRDRETWIVPVSSFGFVRGNGAPNWTKLTASAVKETSNETAGDAAKTAAEGWSDAPLVRERSGDGVVPAMTIAEARKFWMPYGVYDPFEFLAMRRPTDRMFLRDDFVKN